ncbi:hypothetical protein F4824DRAFT_501951 [Ustulina deusta]|nr:hypothetical protein F4824DRAFT_501951 [Ustulina deusta]
MRPDEKADVQDFLLWFFLNSDLSQNWLRGMQKTIFALGDRGVGKTDIASAVIDDLSTRSGVADLPALSEHIIILAVIPGNLRTNVFRDQRPAIKLLTYPVNYPAVNGAYTQLWAGLSLDLSLDKSGSFVAPFGRFYPMRSDLEAATKLESEGGNGSTQKFWDWSEEQLKPFY